MTNISYGLRKWRLTDFIFNELPAHYLKHLEAAHLSLSGEVWDMLSIQITH